jgi:ketosteroid isomerase-like protein
MPSAIRVHCLRSLAALCLSSSAAPAAAQVMPPPPRNVRAEYLSIVSSAVGESARGWARALGAGDVKGAARFLDADAHLLTATGTALRGRKAFEEAYARLRGRIRNIAVEPVDVTYSGQLAFLSGRLRYEVLAAKGGSYQRETTVGMAFRETAGGWRLVAQVGGDFAPQAEMVKPMLVQTPGAPDIIAVRVTDAFGAPLAQGRVTFSVLSGDGVLEQTAAMTDGRGIARVAYRAGTAPGRQIVQAVAAMVEEEPLLFEATVDSARQGSR